MEDERGAQTTKGEREKGSDDETGARSVGPCRTLYAAAAVPHPGLEALLHKVDLLHLDLILLCPLPSMGVVLSIFYCAYIVGPCLVGPLAYQLPLVDVSPTTPA